MYSYIEATHHLRAPGVKSFTRVRGRGCKWRNLSTVASLTQRPDTGMCFQNSYSKCSEAPANQHTCKYDGNNMLIAAAVQSQRVPTNAVSGFSRTLEDTNIVASLLFFFFFFPDFLFSVVDIMFTHVTKVHTVSHIHVVSCPVP